jgi:hypothetical protein
MLAKAGPTKEESLLIVLAPVYYLSGSRLNSSESLTQERLAS